MRRPPAEGDRSTCGAWSAASDKIRDASLTLAVIRGATIGDPAVRDQPEWSAAVRKAAVLYAEAGDTLANGIAPGTTFAVDQAALAAAAALRTMSDPGAAAGLVDSPQLRAWTAAAQTMEIACAQVRQR